MKGTPLIGYTWGRRGIPRGVPCLLFTVQIFSEASATQTSSRATNRTLGEHQQHKGAVMPISNAWGMVTARHSGKILDVLGASKGSGAPLHQWKVIRDAMNQRFRFERLNDGFYRIRVMHTNKVLDVADASGDNGAAIVQWDWHGGDNQRFRLEEVSDGFYQIRAKHSGRVLDVFGASRDNGARIIQWDWLGGDNQRWRHGVPID